LSKCSRHVVEDLVFKSLVPLDEFALSDALQELNEFSADHSVDGECRDDHLSLLLWILPLSAALWAHLNAWHT
jgi:hypothetical protein